MSNSKLETPEIELFMYSMNQEFPVGKGHNTFLEENTFNEWSADHHNDWEQHSNSPNSPKDNADAKDALTRVVMRKEGFGAIVYDPDLDRVYKVNKSGYQLISELVTASKNNTLDYAHYEESMDNGVTLFVEFLKKAQLWAA